MDLVKTSADTKRIIQC